MEPILLIIDTATAHGAVCITEGSNILASETMDQQTEQAAWMQPAIKRLFLRMGKKLEQIDAVAVSAGPGSYTGLRIAMASAKGICFACDKPLISLSTLRIMAMAVKSEQKSPVLLCPMIDARRMEVYSALYDFQLIELQAPQAIILDENSFGEELKNNEICFFGSGADKFKTLLKTTKLCMAATPATLPAAAALAAETFARQGFQDLALAEPFYVKAFYSPVKANS